MPRQQGAGTALGGAVASVPRQAHEPSATLPHIVVITLICRTDQVPAPMAGPVRHLVSLLALPRCSQRLVVVAASKPAMVEQAGESGGHLI